MAFSGPTFLLLLTTKLWRVGVEGVQSTCSCSHQLVVLIQLSHIFDQAKAKAELAESLISVQPVEPKILQADAASG